MKKYFLSIIIAFLFLMQSGCTFLKVNVGDEIEPFTEKVVSGEGRDKVLLLDLSGVIMSGDGEPVLGGRKKPGLIARMREALDRARQDRAREGGGAQDQQPRRRRHGIGHLVP